MGAGGTVRSPQGQSYRVRRRWVEGPVLKLWERFRANRRESAGEGGLDPMLGLEAADQPAIAVVLVVLIALVVFVLLPLLGVALELIVLLVVILSGLVGRLLLGRPWIVEAVNVVDVEDRAAFAVKGWGPSRAAVAELRTAIAAAGLPDDIGAGERLATRPT
jgi:hypothetical protein